MVKYTLACEGRADDSAIDGAADAADTVDVEGTEVKDVCSPCIKAWYSPGW